jgi:para-aminobenzoate synthetase component I
MDFSKYFNSCVTFKYFDPLYAIEYINNKYSNFVLLNSSQKTVFTGPYSILAFKSNLSIVANNFNIIYQKLQKEKGKSKLNNSFFGYLGYEFGSDIDDKSYITVPKSIFASYDIIFIFDHIQQDVKVSFNNKDDLLEAQEIIKKLPTGKKIAVSSFFSNMTDNEYYSKVEKIRQHIIAGDCYQANLTRKYYGEFANNPNISYLFYELMQNNPAPYGALLKFDDLYILSSSPEQFLKIEDGVCTARPIKGTTPRSEDVEINKQNKIILKNDKNISENLMITDLMRNDFARNAIIGSVNVPYLFEATEYKHVHHLSSTITCKKKDDCNIIQFIEGCFPPGSMTGAPKIMAMKVCRELEQYQRGVYSGAIGYINYHEEFAELSVVIRTIIIKDNKFEFQVGGAIVYDSTPENELEEIKVKAKGICKSLGIEI